MVFTIKQQSTLPKLKMRLYRDGRNDFHKFDEMLENSVITFAMKDEKNGFYKIANKAAEIELRDPSEVNSHKEYYVVYTFTKEDTDKAGIFIGEFKIIFLDEQLQPTGELIAPIGEELYIHINNSFIKSDITYVN